MRRYLAVAAVPGLFALGVWLATPAAVVDAPLAPELPADLDRYLAGKERAVDEKQGIVPGTAKRIVWRQAGRRTRYAVVYLHGFSASRQEIAPVPELVADALEANLFETRLAGHGLSRKPLAGVTAEDWLADAAEALAVGSRIGERVVLIGTSTGATLALAMAGHPAVEPVAAMILVSPNFGPADERAELLTGPAGPVVARVLVGDTRSWEPHNARQARYWTTTYPIDAAVEVMRLVDHVRSRLPLTLDAGLLVFYSEADRVVSPAATVAALAAIEAAPKRIIVAGAAGDPSRHVLAGDILSPATTSDVAATIAAFVRGR